MKDRIIVRNARQHNLKGLDLDLPRRALNVLTGPSGSGKSSLAFDTIYAEGQRRYVESLSSYAKQFLERMEKPDVDRLDGISPAVAIEQKNPTKTSRSTVGTATEVYDYLRLLWARAGRTICPECGRQVVPDTVQSATDVVLDRLADRRIMIVFPLPRSARISHARIVENLRALGFVRVLARGEPYVIDEPRADDAEALGVDLAGLDDLLVVVDRTVAKSSERERIADSLGTAFVEGEGEALVIDGVDGERLVFTEHFRCPEHPEQRFLEPTPRLFSFNNPYGSCPTCTGFGAVLEYDLDLIIPNPNLSIEEGAVDPWQKPRYGRQRAKLESFARSRRISLDRPWHDMPAGFRDAVLNGTRGFQGVLPFMRSREKKRYKQYIRVFLRQYQTARRCPDCDGAKLRAEALAVHVNGRNIAQAAGMQLAALRTWLEALDPSAAIGSTGGATVAAIEPILRELLARLTFLQDVGLGYLTLDRQTRTLSGGEAQRISLANALGSSLVDTLYVLDEPTVGLHPRDTDRLLALLARLRDAGNTVLVVEHDAAVIRAADRVIELGPGAGERGGEIVYNGAFEGLVGADTATGRFLAGEREPARPHKPPAFAAPRLTLKGARLHNLKGIDVEFPIGSMTVVTGVSGSGKSTLVHSVLYRALERELAGRTTAKRHLGEAVGHYDALEGTGYVDAAVLVDQAPIGKSYRSNPATYIKAFDHIRSVFAAQPMARQHGYDARHFSFNVRGGRCEACQGEGVITVEMVFLADVHIPCDVCHGARYRAETLEVTFKGRNIRDVLEMTVDEAIRFFIREDKLGQMLWQLQQVGLGYLRLGQPAPTLSGGEAQRLKIARELITASRKRGRRVYIMDEPTTGLSGPEVGKLLHVLRRLLNSGHTVIVIEHNVEMMRAADWIIDLGPEAGDAGGRVVAMGTPAEVARSPDSRTAEYLRAEVPGVAMAGTRPRSPGSA